MKMIYDDRSIPVPGASGDAERLMLEAWRAGGEGRHAKQCVLEARRRYLFEPEFHARVKQAASIVGPTQDAYLMAAVVLLLTTDWEPNDERSEPDA